MAAWMLSGGAIPLLLPAGTHHNYYFWGVVVPLTLTATVCLTHILHRIPVRTDTMLRGAIAVLVVFASANILVYETQYLDNSELAVHNADYKSVDRGPIDLEEGEAVEIGRQIRPLVESPRDIAFVGNWRRQQFSEFYRGGVIRILIYSEVRSSGAWHDGLVSSDRSESPQYVSNVSSVDRSGCEVMVVRHDNRSGSVRTC